MALVDSNTYIEPTAGTSLSTARLQQNQSYRSLLTNFSGEAPPVGVNLTASGDPLSDSIVLWTRITHRFEPETTQVRWVVLDSEGAEVASAVELAAASSDFTVKVIVDGLLPATEYKLSLIHISEPTRRS